MRGIRIIALIVAAGFVGCTKHSASDAPSASPAGASIAATPQATGTAAPASQPIHVPANASPDRVVTVFLDALRAGDSPTTESLLTTKARQELAKHQLYVDALSAPNAIYQVQPAVPVLENPNGAHVTSVWTEKFDDGDEKYEIVWALRKQPEGWRLAGMAMQLVPGQQVQILNFEDPADMIKKKDEAMSLLQGPAIETAQQPPQGAKAQAPAIER